MSGVCDMAWELPIIKIVRMRGHRDQSDRAKTHKAPTSLFRKYKMFEVYPCVSAPNRLRLSSKVVRWEAQDMWITVICRGFRGFAMVGRGAAPKKTPETQESEMTDLAPTKIGDI